MNNPPIESVDGRSLNHADFPHLPAFKREALRRLANSFGIAVVAAVLTATPEAQQRVVIQDFVTRELADLRRRVTTPAQPETEIVKLDVSNYSGEGPHRLALNRWLCEVDIVISVRQPSSEQARTHYLLSKLNTKAKEWALGKLVADASSFPTLQLLKADSRVAFEPPQDDYQCRAPFLALRQDRSTMLDYILRTRHHALCVVEHPIDMVTQVHMFVAGINSGHPRLYLMRKPPATLEETFTIALREDYSIKASRHRAYETRVDDKPIPMEIDAIERAAPVRRGRFTNGRSRKSSSAARQLTCFFCRKIGHRAAECRALAPVVTALDADGGQPDERASSGNERPQKAQGDLLG